ncbi:MAG TPA: hypothetical protein VI386_25490 [Candidatus Sulfotelmatobacter sp.]
MRKQYLHLSTYSCDKCAGPVVAGWLAVRENEIAQETDIRQLGAMCLSCGQDGKPVATLGRVRNLSPIEWQPVHSGDRGTATVE